MCLNCGRGPEVVLGEGACGELQGSELAVGQLGVLGTYTSMGSVLGCPVSGSSADKPLLSHVSCPIAPMPEWVHNSMGLGLESGSMVKSSDSTSRGPEFNPQQPT